MSKKGFLSLVLSMLMIFTFATSGLAAGLSDVEGTKYSSAVERLNALSIMTGYPDGTFGVEKSITRAEFSALAVRALGLESTAKASAGATQFKDVTKEHWASGYVNLAASKGIIKGYPDGTFKPEANVSYAEAVTMLVRVLGYEPAVEGSNWPSNYLAEAAEIGFLGNLDFTASNAANRGDVAILLNNSLDADIMEQVGYGTDATWEEQPDQTLLTEFLNVHELEEAVVTMTAGYSQDTLDADEVQITDENGDTYTFQLKEGLSLDALLGHEVTAFVLDDDNDENVEDDEVLIMVTSTTDEKDIIAWDYVVGIGQDTDNDADSGYDLSDGGMTVSLDDTDDTFDFADNAVVYYNHEKVTDLGDMAADKVGVGFATLGEVAGTFILNEDDEVIFMNLFNYDDPFVVTDVDVDDEKVSYFKDDIDNETTLKLDGETYAIYKNGELASLEDIAVDDVLYKWELTDGSYVLEAYDYKISGTLESVYSDGNNYWDYVLVVDGKQIYAGPNFTYSMDENDTTDLLGTGIINTSADYGNAFVPSDNLTDLEDLIGSEVTVYVGKYYEATDGWNYGRHVVSSVDASVSTYFMVTDDAWEVLTTGMKYYIELVNGTDQEIVYELTEDDTEFDNVVLDLSVSANMTQITADYPVGTLVDVSFNGDGTISSIEKVTELVADDVTSISEDYDRIQIGGKWYNVTDGTVFFDAAEGEATDWASIEDVNLVTTDLTVDYAAVDDYELEAVVVNYTTGSVGTSDYGLVLYRSVTADGLVVNLAVDGVVDDYDASDLSESKQDELLEGTLVDFTASGNALDTTVVQSVYEFETGVTSYEIVSGGVDSKNGVIEVVAAGGDEDTDPTYFIDVDQYGVDSFFYDVDSSWLSGEKVLSLSDLTDGDIINAYDVNSDGIFDYIVVVDR